VFFDGWEVIARTLLVGALAYIGLVALVRISGKRTLAKMNAFDLIVTVALGSTLATILLQRNVALAEGLTAFGVLIGMQLAITWFSVRTQAIPSLVKSTPRLLAYRGAMDLRAMREERVTEAEVLQALRQSGVDGLSGARAVVLETDGSLSVISRDQAPDDNSALRNVRGFDG
jgi:uncharacterized membrane protein YcaP (DUF421 family)